MLNLFHQPPAHSPIAANSLVAGLTGAIGIGDPRGRLRKKLIEHYNARDVLLTDSGTTALHLAIRGTLRILESDREATARAVALPAYVCPDVLTSAVGAGAVVRFYDVNVATLGPDWESLQQTLEAGDVSAVVAAHLYGIPVEMARLARVAKAHGALVIDDAAQGFGGRIGDRPLGAIGSLGVLSFGRGKGITGGGGGALLANDEYGVQALEAVRAILGPGNTGWTALAMLFAQWLLGRPALYWIPAAVPWLGLGETRYEEPWPPRGIARTSAAAVLANWRASVEEAEARLRNVRLIADALAGQEEIPSSENVESVPSGLRQPVLLGDVERASHGLRKAGIEKGYPKLPNLSMTARFYDRSNWPQAVRLVRCLWTLPTHSKSDPVKTLNILRATESEGALGNSANADLKPASQDEDI